MDNFSPFRRKKTKTTTANKSTTTTTANKSTTTTTAKTTPIACPQNLTSIDATTTRYGKYFFSFLKHLKLGLK